MARHGWIGVAVLALGTLLFWGGVDLVVLWYTPIMWTGYIVAVDAVVAQRRGSSLLIDRRDELPLMLAASVGWWCVFEFYNVYLENWHYIGQPQSYLVRFVGYAWAYATIFPAIFVTAELLLSCGLERWPHTRPLAIADEWLYRSAVVGVLFVAIPLFLPRPVVWYTFGFVWLGFVFLLEPVLYTCGGRSILRCIGRGQTGVLLAYLGAGVVCGLLWEFWNYWAGAKWVYTVPFWPRLRYFEMPLAGFLGFPPFALECYALYGFSRLLWRWRALRAFEARVVWSTALALVVVLALRILPQPFGYPVEGPVAESKVVAPLAILDGRMTPADLRVALFLPSSRQAPELVAMAYFTPGAPGWRAVVPLLHDPDPEIRRRAALLFRNMSRAHRLAFLRRDPPVVLDIPSPVARLNPDLVVQNQVGFAPDRSDDGRLSLD